MSRPTEPLDDTEDECPGCGRMTEDFECPFCDGDHDEGDDDDDALDDVEANTYGDIA